MNELDVALQVASGELPSPSAFENSFYVALRISGTGVAYRAQLKEFVFRDPKVWLGAEMIRRALGLPVVVEHPPGSILTSTYFGERVVGIVVLAFVRDEELWGVARILDHDACKMIAGGVLDTSPGIILGNGAGAFVELDDGARMLVEDEPSLLDHVALVYVGDGENRGVWTRSDGGNGPGVKITEDELRPELEKELIP